MGRNKAHRKQVRAEKSKVKLKDSKTKFLPKGLNVTNASFKLKPIVLLEQLKLHNEGAILSKRHSSVKEILSRLKHHNKYIKENSLDELRQWIEANPLEIVGNLSDLLPSIVTLVTDVERSTRIKAIKLLDCLFSRIDSPDTLLPFAPLLISHLRSSMSHLNRHIRQDSLILIDTLMRHERRMIAMAAPSLLSVYLAMVSTMHGGGATSGGPVSSVGKGAASTGWSSTTDSSSAILGESRLSVDVGGGVTSVAWRIEVLRMLFRMLEVIGEEYYSNKDEESSDADLAPILNLSECNYYPLIVNYFDRNPFIFSDHNIEDVDIIDKYGKNILSILYDSWAEVVPEQNKFLKSIQGTVLLPSESAAILNSILKIHFLFFHNIYKEQNCSIFDTKTSAKFFDDILKLFPFYRKPAPQKKKDGANHEDPKCVQENLILCYLFSAFNTRLLSQSKIDNCTEIINYLSVVLRHKNALRHNMLYLTKTIKLIFVKNAPYWKKANINMNLLLKNIITYQSAEFNNELFNVLCGLSTEKIYRSLPVYQKYLHRVPILLCQPEVSDNIINKLHKLSVQNNTVFHQGLLEQLPNILSHLASIKVTDDKYLVNPKIKILTIFYYCENITQERLQLFEYFANSLTNGNKKLAAFITNELIPKFTQMTQ